MTPYTPISQPATEVEIAEAIRIADPWAANIIRRLAFERDMLKAKLEREEGLKAGIRRREDGWG